MARHFMFGFLYWARTRKRSYGYIMSKRDYHHALDRYKAEQVIKCERAEMAETGTRVC